MSKMYRIICAACVVLMALVMPAAEIRAACHAPNRIPVEIYRLVVFHAGALSVEDAALVEQLRQMSQQQDAAANYLVEEADVNAPLPPSLEPVWASLETSEALPQLAVRYPEGVGYQRSLWSGALTLRNIKAVLTSPVRQELAARLVDGQAAVWLLLESGDRPRDDDAAHFLAGEIAEMNAMLRSQSRASSDRYAGPEAFSMLRLSRANPDEQILIKMLMYSEPGLSEFQAHPMIFPIFGRGKILYTLAGAGINTATVRMAGSIVTAPTLCPLEGVEMITDLLMLVDWETGVVNALPTDKTARSLTTLSGRK